MPEALLATTPILGDLLGTLGLGTLAGGGAAAAGAGAADAGAAAGLGAADAGAAAGLDALGTGAADLVGPTVAGTIGDTLGAGSFDALAGGALAGTGADVASTIGSSLAFPELLGGGAAAAGGFGAAADSALSSAASSGLASGVGSIPSATAPMDAFLDATPAAGLGTAAAAPTVSSAASPGATSVGGSPSVFDTGTTPISNLANTGTGYVPAGAGTGAPGVSAPSSIATTPDATSIAPGVAPAAPPAAAPTSSISELLGKLSPSNLASDAVSSLVKNPIGVALGAGGLGYNILEGQKQTANEKALQADAATATTNSNQMVASGEALQQYLTSGTLPPQYMDQVDQAIQSAKTNAISNAASQGLPTDPTKNTALAATLAGIDNQRPSMITQVASQLFSSGSSLLSAGQSAAGLSGQLYKALVSNDTTQAGNIGKAIASLASALNGKTTANIGGKSITLQAA